MSGVEAAISQRVSACRKEISSARDELRRLTGELDGLKSAYAAVTEDTAGIAFDLSGPLEEIENRIRLVRQRKITTRNNLSHLEGEMVGLLSAQEILIGKTSKKSSEEDDEGIQKGREISAAWRKILGYFLRSSPNAVSIGDVMNFVAESNISVNRNAVRSQLHLYAQRGYLKRVGEGLYLATDAIKRMC